MHKNFSLEIHQWRHVHCRGRVSGTSRHQHRTQLSWKRNKMPWLAITSTKAEPRKKHQNQLLLLLSWCVAQNKTINWAFPPRAQRHMSTKNFSSHMFAIKMLCTRNNPIHPPVKNQIWSEHTKHVEQKTPWQKMPSGLVGWSSGHCDAAQAVSSCSGSKSAQLPRVPSLLAKNVHFQWTAPREWGLWRTTKVCPLEEFRQFMNTTSFAMCALNLQKPNVGAGSRSLAHKLGVAQTVAHSRCVTNPILKLTGKSNEPTPAKSQICSGRELFFSILSFVMLEFWVKIVPVNVTNTIYGLTRGLWKPRMERNSHVLASPPVYACPDHSYSGVKQSFSPKKNDSGCLGK